LLLKKYFKNIIMKCKLKSNGSGFKCLLAAGLMLASLSGIAQDRSAVIADPKLDALVLTDFSGNLLNPANLSADQLIKLSVPVGIDNGGKALPAGSAKIKIGLGSKFQLDPGFDLANAGGSSYFKWTSVEEGGQLQVTGELINALPANVTTMALSFRLKVVEEGNSTVTANFLITNHNTIAVLSDKNGTNNASAISYQVSKKLPVDPSTLNGNLKLAVFPNPAKDVNAVNISVLQGKLMGKYRIMMYDLAGKLVQTKEMQLTLVSNFTYDFGTVAAGKYLIKVLNVSGTESTVLKFEKL
jgi:hypothetical protein